MKIQNALFALLISAGLIIPAISHAENAAAPASAPAVSEPTVPVDGGKKEEAKEKHKEKREARKEKREERKEKRKERREERKERREHRKEKHEEKKEGAEAPAPAAQ
jgi:transposase